MIEIGPARTFVPLNVGFPVFSHTVTITVASAYVKLRLGHHIPKFRESFSWKCLGKGIRELIVGINLDEFNLLVTNMFMKESQPQFIMLCSLAPLQVVS